MKGTFKHAVQLLAVLSRSFQKHVNQGSLPLLLFSNVDVLHNLRLRRSTRLSNGDVVTGHEFTLLVHLSNRCITLLFKLLQLCLKLGPFVLTILQLRHLRHLSTQKLFHLIGSAVKNRLQLLAFLLQQLLLHQFVVSLIDFGELMLKLGVTSPKQGNGFVNLLQLSLAALDVGIKGISVRLELLSFLGRLDDVLGVCHLTRLLRHSPHEDIIAIAKLLDLLGSIDQL
mmetsp:Transcript_6815/g.7755  ORF Transcript_6815/g.7755 Transcript_6815/m.7755 type:complete len:227 (+) Transcript_6815:311-991(+)